MYTTLFFNFFYFCTLIQMNSVHLRAISEKQIKAIYVTPNYSRKIEPNDLKMFPIFSFIVISVIKGDWVVRA